MNAKTWYRIALSPKKTCTFAQSKLEFKTVLGWFMRINNSKMVYHWRHIFLVKFCNYCTLLFWVYFLQFALFFPIKKCSHHSLVVWWNSQSSCVDLLPRSFQIDETWLWSSTYKERMKRYQVRYRWTSLGSNLNSCKVIKDTSEAIKWEISSFMFLAFHKLPILVACSSTEKGKWKQYTACISQADIPQILAVSPSPISHLLFQL